MSVRRTLVSSARTAGVRPFPVPPLVISGCSGAGKSTLIQRLLGEFPTQAELSVSHTTRKRRKGEEDGRHYHFVGRDEMQELVDKAEFLEVTQYGREMYGTSLSAAKRVAEQRKICVLDLDINGVESLERLQVASKTIFLSVPSLDDLRERLIARGDTSPEQIAERLAAAALLFPYENRTDMWDAVIKSQAHPDDTYSLFRSKVVEWYPFVEAGAAFA